MMQLKPVMKCLSCSYSFVAKLSTFYLPIGFFYFLLFFISELQKLGLMCSLDGLQLSTKSIVYAVQFLYCSSAEQTNTNVTGCITSGPLDALQMLPWTKYQSGFLRVKDHRYNTRRAALCEDLFTMKAFTLPCFLGKYNPSTFLSLI